MIESRNNKLVLTELVLDLPWYDEFIRRRFYIGWLRKSTFDIPVGFVLTHEHYDGFVKWIYVDPPFRRLGIATEMLYAVVEKYPKISLRGATPSEESLYQSFDRDQKPYGDWQYIETITERTSFKHKDEDEDKDFEFPLYVSTTILPWSTKECPRVCRLYHLWDKTWEYVRPDFFAVPCEQFVDGLWIFEEGDLHENCDELVRFINADLQTRVQNTPAAIMNGVAPIEVV